MQSRKHDSITDEDVACLITPGGSDLTEQERLAVNFLDLLSADHHAIDDEVYRELGQVFTAAQIIELGFACANSMGLHRFIHTLDVFGNGEPVIHFDPSQVDSEFVGHSGASAGMSETVLVTGATGLAGANVCKQLIERGDHVRALARASADTEPLSALGVEVVAGDITDAGDVLRAATGSQAAIHCAALLGGASQNLADFQAVNTDGTKHVLDAAEAVGMRRVVAVSTGTFFDTSQGLDREDAPVSKEPSSDPYTITKMAAFEDAMARAAAGQDVVSTHPGAIFGPSPVVSNALGKTSFNRVLVAALRQRLERYLRFPVSWVFGDDVARGCILALDRGVSGERYMLDGQPEDVVSIATACTRICELAGIDHRVEDVDPSDDPELAKVFGPTLIAIASKTGDQGAGTSTSPIPRPTSDWGTTPSASTPASRPPRTGCGRSARSTS